MNIEFEFEGTDAIVVGCDGIGGEIIIPRTVSPEGDDGGHHIVRAIGDYAFSFCDDVRAIMIPDTVVRIDSSAFSNCSNLCDIVVWILMLIMSLMSQLMFSNQICDLYN